MSRVPKLGFGGLCRAPKEGTGGHPKHLSVCSCNLVSSTRAAMASLPELTYSEWSLVYNSLSFGIAAMG